MRNSSYLFFIIFHQKANETRKNIPIGFVNNFRKRISKNGTTLLFGFNALTTKKQATNISSANFQKNVKSRLYHVENSKTRGQTV